MIVLRRYMNNNLRNYNYVIGCEDTRQAIAIDPLDADVVLAMAEEQGLSIKLIINTHEHHDHIGGNPGVKAATGAEILAYEAARCVIPDVDRGLQAGDRVELGSLAFNVLFTPGHTAVHLCLLSDRDSASSGSNGEPVLFSGDTLFNAGAGKCSVPFGGDPDTLYDTFVSRFQPLADDVLLYPGHDYMKNNLAFAQTREPGNDMIQYWQDQVSGCEPDDMPVMNLGQERSYNSFLRLNQPEIREVLLQRFPDLGLGDRDVFKALRSLRDQW